MPRPTTSGHYTVPSEILALKPTAIPCTVKRITTTNNHNITSTHYYVYEIKSIPDPNNPGKMKNSSGSCLGKIEDNRFCPNAKGVLMLGSGSVPEDGSQKPEIAATLKDVSSQKRATQKKFEAVVASMKLRLEDIDLQVKEYGEYAIVLAATKSVLERLYQYFNDEDARLIYVLSVINFIQEYTPASYIKDVYDQSILSNRWPTLAMSENTVNNFLKVLGKHPASCERYAQGLIDGGSGLTAIDAHVILSCSKQNDLADYGNKYAKLGNQQINILQAYDAVLETPLTSKAYEGGLLDKTSVQELLETYSFPSNTVFLVDAGFYSEEDLGLYRTGGKHFEIPVPDSAIISKAIRSHITFTDSFMYQKKNENGVMQNVSIVYRESTVSELEDLYQHILEAETAKKNLDEELTCKNGEKPRKHYTQKLKRSTYSEDRIIMFRDEDMHRKMVDEFRQQIGSDEEHTEERLTQLGPGFGIIVIRTNLERNYYSPKDIYVNYKKRWSIETHYNFLENTIHFYGLQTSDYYSMQGLSFLVLTVGQIKAAYVKALRSSKSSYVRHLSIKESIVKAARFKLSQHQDMKWHIAISTRKHIELLEEMGVNAAYDLKLLNQGT